jgi:hypothetical protein
MLVRPAPASAGKRLGARGPGSSSDSSEPEPVQELPAGSSTVTFVALTEATALTPGTRPSSSAASRLINDTSRNGPACSSTCAITVSFTTLVTMAGKRLRAECAPVGPTSAAKSRPSWRASSASDAPSMSRLPPASRLATSFPESAQRRTVSALTPKRRAASGTLNPPSPSARAALTQPSLARWAREGRPT